MREPAPGKSRAQNTALAEARGEVLLFTDDDVEPAEDWIEKMARPLFGGVTLWLVGFYSEESCNGLGSIICMRLGWR
jgi:glycosyltransferase involved in cell wall biosynthesis